MGTPYFMGELRTDECIRLLSLGHFSRTELVRSFVRTNGDQLPTVYELRILGKD